MVEDNPPRRSNEKTRARYLRKYYRKKEKLEELRDEVVALERQLRALSQDKARESDSQERDGEQGDSQQELEQQLAVLTNTMVRLRAENTQLRRQFREASQRATLLTDILITEHKFYSAFGSYFQILKPLSTPDRLEIHLQASQRMLAFETMSLKPSAIGTIAGWRGRRFVDDNKFKFALEKSFQGMHVDAALPRVWAMLVDPAMIRRMYADEMNMSARLIQKIDDDNYVFLQARRSVDPVDNGAMVNMAVLTSRFKVDNGYRIYSQPLDQGQVGIADRLTGDPVALSRRDLWVSSEQLVWVGLEDTGKNMFTVRFSGVLPTIGATAYYWMTEIMVLCLRTEGIIFGPRFSVPAS